MCDSEFWVMDRFGKGSMIGYLKKHTLLSIQSIYQKIEIIQNDDWGTCLFLDDKIQSAEKDEVIYHQALVHLSMLSHPNPKNVLIIGGGEGATAREVLDHLAIRKVTMVDIDETLVQVCKDKLPQWSNGAFEDPRLELIFADARTWLENNVFKFSHFFDVVIIDLTEPVSGGPATKLYTEEWFRLVRRIMSDNGTMSMQAGSANPNGTFMPNVIKTLSAVFPKVTPYCTYIPSFMDNWGFALCYAQPTHPKSPEQLADAMTFRCKTKVKEFFLPWTAFTMAIIPPWLDKKLLNEGRIMTDAEPYNPEEEGHRF